MDVDDLGLRDDVRRALGVIGDAAALPPVFDQLAVTPPGPPKRRAVQWFATAAVVVALIAGLVSVAGRDPTIDVGPASPPSSDSSANSTSTPGTTGGTTESLDPSTVVSGDWSWLDAFGTEDAHPTAPDSWRWQDVEGLRFAVPGDWVTPISPCAPPGSGIVLTPATVDSSSTCEPAAGDPPASVTVRHSPNDNHTGTPVTVGTRSAEALIEPACGGCPATYRFDDGLDLTVTGPDSPGIVDTITDAGAHRVLQAGPTLDTDGWRTITFDTISMDVPAHWEIVDVPGSYHSSIDADGNQSISGYLDPGSCTPSLFDPANSDTAWLGSSPIAPRCPHQLTTSIEPVDALWIRDDSDTDGTADRSAIASGQTNGLNIVVLAPLTDQVGSQLDLVATNGNHRIVVTLGIGIDASTSRTILHSLRPADNSEASD